MTNARRWIVIGAGAAVVSVLTVAAASASFATGLTPGNTKFSQQAVYASFYDEQGNLIDIQAVSGRQSFRPRSGGPLITEDTTRVLVSGYTQDGLFGSGCWTVSSSPFAIRASDMSATLSFDSAADGVAPCPGDPINAGEVVRSSLTPSSFIEGLSGAVVLTAIWSPMGSAANRQSTMIVSCGSFGAVSQMDSTSQGSSSTATVSSLTVQRIDPDTGNVTEQRSLAGSYSTNFALVQTASFTQTVNGPSTGSCGPFGEPTPTS